MIRDEIVLNYDSLVFWMGSFPIPQNPQGFPDVFPFSLILQHEIGLFSQRNMPDLENLLEQTYAYGSTVGNAMDDSALGLRYSEDFLHFIQSKIVPSARILEIGAGRAYLASRLKGLGYHVDALEPGEKNRKYWEKYQVETIQDMFPSKKAPGPYGVIILYGVLEHIYNTRLFLNQIAEHLTSTGIIFLSVPDCTEEIEAGDPSMLLHQHYQYYTASSLQRCLQSSGFEAFIQKSGYGRSLYALARVSNKTGLESVTSSELEVLHSYPQKCQLLTEKVEKRLKLEAIQNSIGIYCPGRAISILPHDTNVRFFDDSRDIHGNYFPPFNCRIESRDELLRDPPKELWIMSRTFGENLKTLLTPELPNTKILLVNEL